MGRDAVRVELSEERICGRGHTYGLLLGKIVDDAGGAIDRPAPDTTRRLTIMSHTTAEDEEALPRGRLVVVPACMGYREEVLTGCLLGLHLSPGNSIVAALEDGRLASLLIDSADPVERLTVSRSDVERTLGGVDDIGGQSTPLHQVRGEEAGGDGTTGGKRTTEEEHVRRRGNLVLVDVAVSDREGLSHRLDLGSGVTLLIEPIDRVALAILCTHQVDRTGPDTQELRHGNAGGRTRLPRDQIK